MTAFNSADLPQTELRYYPLSQLGDVSRLPMTVKILLEGVLRAAAGGAASEEDVRALAKYPTPADATVPFRPSRILLQDFTGVPAAVDLAAMRAAMHRAGKDPARIEPLIPVDLVIDHSVQADFYGAKDVYQRNLAREYERNRERYALLRWAQQAFKTFRVVPPGAGICHQVNLERLARVVQVRDGVAVPDTLFGADSHTTMVNGVGVLGWGVGGIEAEAAMLGQPTYLPWPVVVGVRLHGSLPVGTTATDLVLTLTEKLRKHGVVNKFVEFAGDGLSALTVADRATVSNMCPEYGATAAYFPIDEQTTRYLAQTGREPELIALVERYARAQGLYREDGMAAPAFDEMLELDLGTIEPSVAGPKRPQDRVALAKVWTSFDPSAAGGATPKSGDPGPKPVNDAPVPMPEPATRTTAAVAQAPREVRMGTGAVVIAAITSCTNTSNPSVMLAAGLLAKKAIEAGLTVKPYVKTTLAPGSRVVTRYLDAAGLTPYLEQLGFYFVGVGCFVCIGNSGPLATPEIEEEVKEKDLNVVAVLSGNRNFEGRIHPLVKSSYLASPPLVVAYALAGTVEIDLQDEPIGTGRDGRAVFLRDIWPSPDEVNEAIGKSLTQEMFATEYAKIFEGDENWKTMPAPTGLLYAWDPSSTYVQEPPFFKDLRATASAVADISDARALVVVGDSVTTDHISPAGSIPAHSPAGQYLVGLGVKPVDFNQYGTRRGNHEVLMRGTFGNIRLRNALVTREGFWTRHLPDGEEMTIFDAAMRYQRDSVPLVVLAGKEYGSGSSRDWAAKGPLLLGVRAVIAESFERIHRSNLVGMGILPLQYLPGEDRAKLGLTGEESFTIRGLDRLAPRATVEVEARRIDGGTVRFNALARVDDPVDVEYLRHGGILTMVLREVLAKN
ncbi:MAG TPA: aconitate hydratase AcnA [Candidatus Limnocylindria bacterium]|nr:aconitate hydratase AcnA [Candidatus Limnocylindria bacterium]